MFQHLKNALIVVLACFGSSCSNSSMDSHYDALVTDYGSQLDAMKTMTAEHAAAIEAASQLTAVMDEEDAHSSDMNSVMDDMMMTSSELETCGMMDDTDMTGMVDDMAAVMEEHHADMAAATDLETAEQREAEYQDEMDAMIQAMEDNYDAMYGMMGMDGMGC